LHGCREVIGHHRGEPKDLGAEVLHAGGLHAENITARLDDEGQFTHLRVSHGHLMRVEESRFLATATRRCDEE